MQLSLCTHIHTHSLSLSLFQRPHSPWDKYTVFHYSQAKLRSNAESKVSFQTAGYIYWSCRIFRLFFFFFNGNEPCKNHEAWPLKGKRGAVGRVHRTHLLTLTRWKTKRTLSGSLAVEIEFAKRISIKDYPSRACCGDMSGNFFFPTCNNPSDFGLRKMCGITLIFPRSYKKTAVTLTLIDHECFYLSPNCIIPISIFLLFYRPDLLKSKTICCISSFFFFFAMKCSSCRDVHW